MNKKVIYGLVSVLIVVVGFFLFKPTQKEKKFEMQECNKLYDFTYSSDIFISDPIVGTQKIVNDIKGTLGFRVYDVSNDEIKAAFYLNPEYQKLNGKLQYQEATKEMYSQVLLIKMNKFGMIKDYELSNSVHIDDENLIYSMIQPLQWVYNVDGKLSYDFEELDANGIYSVKYDANTKKKTSYKDNKVKVFDSLLQSDILASKCWHNNASLKESLSYDKTSTKPAIKTNVKLDIKYLSNLDINHPLMQIGNYDKTWSDYEKPSVVKRTVRDRYTSLSEYSKMKKDNVKLTDIISKLVKGSKHELEDQLLAYLLNDPKALDEIVDGIKNNAYDEYQMGILLRVIGKMNTQKAQIVLSEILIGEHTLDDKYRFWAALELGKQTSVIPDIVRDRMFEQLDFVGVEGESQLRISASIYSLGTLSSKLSNVNSTYVNEINDRLISLLSSSGDEQVIRKAFLLGALANSGVDSYGNIGKQYINHEDKNIRKRAVLILKNDSSTDATVTLEDKFLNESDSIVKSTILTTLAKRTPQNTSVIRDEVIKLANTEESQIARSSAVEYLLYQLPPTQENKKIFIELLQKENLMENVEKLVFKIKSIK